MIYYTLCEIGNLQSFLQLVFNMSNADLHEGFVALYCSITEDEYLDMLKHSNDGIDFGDIMDYSTKEEYELDEYLKEFMQAT